MIGRYFRALFLALKFTMRGKRITPAHPSLDIWAREAARRAEAVYRAANANGLDAAARKSIHLHLDKRDINMETILASVKHHVTVEYVKLLLDSTPHTFVAIYASNLNDRYRVAQLCEQVTQPEVQAALRGLSEHLEMIPSQPDVKNL
jgi:hypothetical protein